MELLRRNLFANARLHAVGAVALAAFVSVSPAAAQVSVEVSPLRVELKTDSGGATTQAITIHNTGREAVRVRAAISDWHLSMQGAPQFVSEADERYSASGWIRIAPPEQVIAGGAEATVRFTLTVPSGTTAAGYRTSVLFEFSPASGSPLARERDVAVRSRIATLIYVNVGNPDAAIELADLKPRIAVGRPAEIVAVLKNTGRRSVRTRGTMRIYNGAGEKVAELPVPDVPVLPESEREVAIDTVDPDEPRPLPPGEYRVEVRIDAGMPAVLVGETTLKVS